jgi:hypothetical protein
VLLLSFVPKLYATPSSFAIGVVVLSFSPAAENNGVREFTMMMMMMMMMTHRQFGQWISVSLSRLIKE